MADLGAIAPGVDERKVCTASYEGVKQNQLTVILYAV
jgi:hypothetical protein